MGKSLEHFSILELVSVHDLPKGPLSKPNSRLQFCREQGSFDKAMGVDWKVSTLRSMMVVEHVKIKAIFMALGG